MELKQKVLELIVARQLQLRILAVIVITEICDPKNLVPIDYLIF